MKIIRLNLEALGLKNLTKGSDQQQPTPVFEKEYFEKEYVDLEESQVRALHILKKYEFGNYATTEHNFDSKTLHDIITLQDNIIVIHNQNGYSREDLNHPERLPNLQYGDIIKIEGKNRRSGEYELLCTFKYTEDWGKLVRMFRTQRSYLDYLETLLGPFVFPAQTTSTASATASAAPHDLFEMRADMTGKELIRGGKAAIAAKSKAVKDQKDAAAKTAPTTVSTASAATGEPSCLDWLYNLFKSKDNKASGEAKWTKDWDKEKPKWHKKF